MDRKSLENTIGTGVYENLEKIADSEVGLAKRFKLETINGNQDSYYRPTRWLPLTLQESSIFEEKGLTISPSDVINIIFRCKMLFATSDQQEYLRRVGGGSYPDEDSFIVPQKEKSKTIDILIDEYLNRLDKFQSTKVLITKIQRIHGNYGAGSGDNTAYLQDFFQKIFNVIGVPFTAYIEDDQLLKEYIKHIGHQTIPDSDNLKKEFQSPSIGFTTHGSKNYCYRYGKQFLRTFINLLKTAGFIYPSQVEFRETDIVVMAPTGPFFLGSGSSGAYNWHEESQQPREKSPDGHLRRSFGYRGMSKMWLDQRNFEKIKKFFINHKIIFEQLKNPRGFSQVNDIAPTLDILASVTQIGNLGAKILLLYCCLEHLFVPKNKDNDNKKYIIGGINALKPELIEWFNRLYKLRCDYAHKGFIKENENILGLVMESITNVMILLTIKLSNK